MPPTFATPRLPVLTIFLLSLLGGTISAQEAKPPTGFDYAKPKEAAKGVAVVPGETEAKPDRVWKLDFAGFRASRHPAIVPVVENVTLYTNGRMRVHFAMRNNSDQDEKINMNFERSYMIDPDAESYKPLDRDILPEVHWAQNVTFPAGTKTRFWMEFDAPKKPTTKFKIFLATDETNLQMTVHNEFPPFIITLKEPISAKSAESAAPGKSDGGGPDLAAAMRAIAKGSQRFEGSAITVKGAKEAVAVVFQPDPDDEDGVIAQMYPIKEAVKKTSLQGWIMPDATTPSGLIIKMKGSGVSYRFSLDGKNLSGLDNKGGKYLLLPVRKGPG